MYIHLDSQAFFRVGRYGQPVLLRKDAKAQKKPICEGMRRDFVLPLICIGCQSKNSGRKITESYSPMHQNAKKMPNFRPLKFFLILQSQPVL